MLIYFLTKKKPPQKKVNIFDPTMICCGEKINYETNFTGNRRFVIFFYINFQALNNTHTPLFSNKNIDLSPQLDISLS